MGPFFMSIYIRMPTINFSVTQSIETLAVNLSASEALVMNINNPLIGASYFGLETIPDNNGVYTSTAPKNTSGSFTLGTGVLGVVRDDYKMSAVVSPGNNVLTFSPAVAVTGSSLRTRGISSPPLSTGVDADAQAFFNRVTAAGGTLSGTEQTAVNTLVVQMKADGTWTPMKAIYPMVGASAAACAQNLKSSSFTGTFTSGWTFASTGVTGNGTSAYMDTNLNPNTTMTNYFAHLSFYNRTDNSSTGIDIGCLADGAADNYFLQCFSVGLNATRGAVQRLNNYNLFTPTDKKGFFVANTSASNNSKLYQNGTLKNTNTTTDLAIKPPRNIVIGAANYTSVIAFSNRECAFSTIGDSLTDTQASNFYTAVQAFQVSLSRSV
jgi:hypothetical protein